MLISHRWVVYFWVSYFVKLPNEDIGEKLSYSTPGGKLTNSFKFFSPGTKLKWWRVASLINIFVRALNEICWFAYKYNCSCLVPTSGHELHLLMNSSFCLPLHALPKWSLTGSQIQPPNRGCWLVIVLRATEFLYLISIISHSCTKYIKPVISPSLLTSVSILLSTSPFKVSSSTTDCLLVPS